jgi:hypothetical protein
MSSSHTCRISAAVAAAALLSCYTPVSAQPIFQMHALITQSIDETELVTLSRNTRREMTPTDDRRGAVADNLVLRMYTLLKWVSSRND